MGWKRKTTTVLHQGQFLTLHRDTVQRPDGNDGIYEHVSVNDGVRIVALDGDDVILIEDDFYLLGRRALYLPGGGTDGQDPMEAARRELAEETGFTAEHLQPLGAIDPLPATTSAREYLYLATGLRPGPPNREATEAGMTVHRWKLTDAVAAVRSGRITEAASVAALLLAEQLA